MHYLHILYVWQVFEKCVVRPYVASISVLRVLPPDMHACMRRRQQRTGRQTCMGPTGRDPMQARGPHRFFLNNIFLWLITNLEAVIKMDIYKSVGYSTTNRGPDGSSLPDRHVLATWPTCMLLFRGLRCTTLQVQRPRNAFSKFRDLYDTSLQV
jgi:hypothetical protein